MSPKVGASMADVSTDFVPVDPDLYTVQISKVEFKDKGGRHTYVVKSKIIVGEGTGAQYAGKTINDHISMHKKDGESNEFGLIQLKRYVEAVFPESKTIENVQEGWSKEEWDDFDTDQLQGQNVQLQVKIDTFKKDENSEPQKNNKVERVLSVG